MPEVTVPKSKSKCRYCGAPVIWVRMAGTGKNHPCNVPVLTTVTNDGRIAKGRTSHFASCPKADQARKRKKASE